MISNHDQSIAIIKIKNIISDLKKFMGQDKADILAQSIELRLNKSLKLYYDNLSSAFDRLEDYSEKESLKMMKKLNKE